MFKTIKTLLHAVKVTVCVSGTFELFNIVCEQHHRTAVNPLNGIRCGICKQFFSSSKRGRSSTEKKLIWKFNNPLVDPTGVGGGGLWPMRFQVSTGHCTRLRNELNTDRLVRNLIYLH